MPVLDEREREDLVAADTELSNLQHALEAAARSGAIDQDVIDRLTHTARQVVERINQNLPPQVDAEARDEIRKRLIDLLMLQPDAEPHSGAGLLDLADKALIEAEAVRHVVRDLLQEQAPVEVRKAGAVVQALETWLPGLTVHELAELLGISERQLQRRRGDDGQSTSRMQLVLRLVAILRNGWTDRGVYAWFHRARSDLGGHPPTALLEDPARERDLLVAARSGRVQGGL